MLVKQNAALLASNALSNSSNRGTLAIIFSLCNKLFHFETILTISVIAGDKVDQRRRKNMKLVHYASEATNAALLALNASSISS